MFRATRTLANHSRLANRWATFDGEQLWAAGIFLGGGAGMVAGATAPEKGSSFDQKVGAAVLGAIVGAFVGAASPILVPSAIVAGAVHLFK
jgi:hypothetical protein